MAKKKSKDGLIVRRSRAGLGLYTDHPIKKGERVIEYIGRVVSEKEAYTSRSKYLFEVSKTKTLDGKPKWNKAGYINHSCLPNCEPEVIRGHIYIEAKRNIKAGEELAYDYGKEYFDDYITPSGCRCPKHVGKGKA